MKREDGRIMRGLCGVVGPFKAVQSCLWTVGLVLCRKKLLTGMKGIKHDD